MLGKEAKVLFNLLSQLMANKTKEPFSHIRGWINGWITIEVAWSYSLMLHGTWLCSPFQERDPTWESGSGLWLSQSTLCQIIFAPKSFCATYPATLLPPNPPGPTPVTHIIRVARRPWAQEKYATCMRRQWMGHKWIQPMGDWACALSAHHKTEHRYQPIKIGIWCMIKGSVRKREAKSDRYIFRHSSIFYYISCIKFHSDILFTPLLLCIWFIS